MSTVFKISYEPPPLEVLNQSTQLPAIPLPISPPNLTITRRLIFPSILSTSFAPTSSPTTFVIKTTSVKPTWNQLSTKIRDQFNIPEDINFSLTYMDAGGKEMALSSQDELINYFSQDEGEVLPILKNNCSYKFGLTILPQNNNVEEDKKGGDNDIKEFEKAKISRTCDNQQSEAVNSNILFVKQNFTGPDYKYSRRTVAAPDVTDFTCYYQKNIYI
ncbi:5729_t:CDS:2 [Funneliformis mosseae]|uniref:5729_t:CDS:1 n=1 Tax=Funneliformis mosseae TaxID=27381 RepID=A0A9N8ZVU0_FUNMO|nr:5729_t:CDS:2 [Funneliformis mosseae]